MRGLIAAVHVGSVSWFVCEIIRHASAARLADDVTSEWEEKLKAAQQLQEWMATLETEPDEGHVLESEADEEGHMPELAPHKMDGKADSAEGSLLESRPMRSQHRADEEQHQTNALLQAETERTQMSGKDHSRAGSREGLATSSLAAARLQRAYAERDRRTIRMLKEDMDDSLNSQRELKKEKERQVHADLLELVARQRHTLLSLQSDMGSGSEAEAERMARGHGARHGTGMKAISRHVHSKNAKEETAPAAAKKKGKKPAAWLEEEDE